MFQTTSSINSQHSPKAFKLKSKVSFFNDTMIPQNTIVRVQQKEQLNKLVDSIQPFTQFLLLPEFEQMRSHQIAVSLHYCYNPQFMSTGSEITKEAFHDLLDEIKQTINRKFPFIRLYRQEVQQKEHFLQVQFYQPETYSIVIYNRSLTKVGVSGKLISDLVCLYLKKFSLTVNVDCGTKNIVPVCEEGINNSVLEGLKVVIRQRENQVFSNQTPTKQIVIRTSFCQPSSGQKSASKIDIFKSIDNIRDMEKSVRVYFSPNKFQTTTVSQIDLSEKKHISPEKKFTVKLFSQTQYTTCFEEVKFNDLVQQVNNYEVEISGNAIQTAKTQLNVDELLNSSSDTLYLTTRVERTDLLRCLINAPEDATVNVTKISSETIQYDQIEKAFVFWGRSQQEYLIEVSKKDCFPLKRHIFLQGSVDITIEFDLVSCVETTLQFKAYNIILRNGINKEIEHAKLEIMQSDQIDQESSIGQTDQQGMFSCPGLMFKQVRVHAQRKGFLQVSYDFDVRANSTGQTLNIPMIPDYYSLINQYHILIYVPNKHNFQLDYSLICPDGQKLDSKNRQHKVMKSKLEINRITQNAVLWNFSVHVQSMDPFLPDNCFSFFVNNQKPKRKLMCQEPLSPQCKENKNTTISYKSVNLQEQFLKTRVMQTEIKSFVRQESDVIAQKITNYCAEESVRIFVTFGNKVLETIMIQTNLLMQNEKCFGVIDLDKRQFFRDNEAQQNLVKRNLSKMPKFKRESIQLEDRTLTTILSHITNQQFLE